MAESFTNTFFAPTNTLTIDKLKAAVAAIKRALPPLGIRQIVASPHWPQECVGHWIKPVRAHPWICWLARTFPWLHIRTHVMWVGLHTPMMRDADAMLDRATGTLYCSPRQKFEIELRIGHMKGSFIRGTW